MMATLDTIDRLDIAFLEVDRPSDPLLAVEPCTCGGGRRANPPGSTGGPLRVIGSRDDDRRSVPKRLRPRYPLPVVEV